MDFSIKVLAISDNSNFSIFFFIFFDNDVDVNDVDDDDVDDDVDDDDVDDDDDVVSQLVSVSV